VDVTDRHCQGVGGVVGHGHDRKAKNQLHHVLHLLLVGAAVSDHRPLDLGGRVLRDRHPGFHRGKHRHSTSMPELEGAARVHGVKDLFDGDRVGPELEQKGRKAGVNLAEFLGERCGPGRPERAAA
jgi:hypothetical protein